MQTVTKKIEFLKSCFGEDHKMSRDGNNISFVCPKCGDEKKKKKLSICLESLMCHCWVCGLKGKTPYKIIKDHISQDLAAKFLKEFNVSGNKEKEGEEELLTFPSEFKLLASLDSLYDPDDRDCVDYLKRRGVTKEKMLYHKIGKFAGYKWSRRIVFPSFDMQQKLTFFVSRSIDKDAFIKYQNCKADKTQMVFDEIRLDYSRELTIVEGVFDLVKCPDNSTCILGSSLRPEHLLFQKIVKNQTPVILALDSDMIDKSYAIAESLNSYGVQVKILDLGKYKDVGSMTEEIVRQKCLEAPIYSRHNRLRHLIGTISSGSIF
jgi:predicted RNA-binding Zn-ribbon protein involved in translation (DUF1610 family)